MGQVAKGLWLFFIKNDSKGGKDGFQVRDAKVKVAVQVVSATELFLRKAYATPFRLCTLSF